MNMLEERHKDFINYMEPTEEELKSFISSMGTNIDSNLSSDFSREMDEDFVQSMNMILDKKVEFNDEIRSSIIEHTLRYTFTINSFLNLPSLQLPTLNYLLIAIMLILYVRVEYSSIEEIPDCFKNFISSIKDVKDEE